MLKLTINIKDEKVWDGIVNRVHPETQREIAKLEKDSERAFSFVQQIALFAFALGRESAAKELLEE